MQLIKVRLPSGRLAVYEECGATNTDLLRMYGRHIATKFATEWWLVKYAQQERATPQEQERFDRLPITVGDGTGQ